MGSISTSSKKKQGELRQVRIEHVFQTRMSDDDMDDFTQEQISEFSAHLDPDADEKIIITCQTPMDDIDEAESKRLQDRYEKSVAAVEE